MIINDLTSLKWDKETYNEFKEFLKSNGEQAYAEFNKRIIPDIGETYGVRMPLLRKIALSISKNDDKESAYEYLNSGTTHEEKLILGMLLPNLRFYSEEEMFNYIEAYVLKINNWALCDSFVGDLKKSINKQPNMFYDKIDSYLKSKNPWEIRFGLILFNNYFAKKEYISDIFKKLKLIKSDHYYVNMGISWLVSTCYLADKDATIELLKSNSLGKWCTNKSIQKIKESLRVSKEEKQEINKLKIK